MPSTGSRLWGVVLAIAWGVGLLAMPAGVRALPDDERLASASAAFEHGSYATAIATLTEWLRESPAPHAVPSARFLLGRAYLANGQYPEALIELQQALGPAGSPPAAETIYWFAEALLSNHDEAAARAAFQQVLDQFPASPLAPFALYSIGWSHWDTGRWAEALASFQMLIRQYPEDPLRIESEFRAGECLVHLERFQEAAAWFQTFVESYPVTTYAQEAYYRLGESFAHLQQWAPAIAAYEKAVGASRRGPWPPMAQIGIGLAQAAQQQYGEAADAFADFLEFYPRHARRREVQLALARSQMALGRLDEARDLLLSLARQAPQGPGADEVLFWIAEILQRQHRMPEAAGILTQLLERCPDSPRVGDATYALGWVQVARHDPAATETLQRAARLGRTAAQRASALAMAGDLWFEQRDYPQAAATFDRLLNEYPDSPLTDRAQYQLGRALLAMGRYDAARLAFDALLSRFPRSPHRPPALFYAGLADLLRGSPASAAPRFDAAAHDDAAPPTLTREAQFHLGAVLATLGQPEAASTLFRTVLRDTPPHDDLHRRARARLALEAHP